MLPILFQDEHIVVIDKPSGLLVHRTALAWGETEFAMQQLRDQIDQHVFPIHRLDRPTSGVLVFALNSEIARKLSDAFANREVEKTYHAVVRGYMPDSGVIDYPLVEELDDVADKQASKTPEAKEAITEFETVAKVELPFKVSKKHDTSRFSLVKCKPKTGRKHQIRRHLAHLRHPIIGDTNHGDGRQNRFFREHFDCHRLLLIASAIRFEHPVTQEEIHLELPLPEVFKTAFRD
ncbi:MULTISPECIES: tRNA pseudouridine(65) synthase TruC [Gammaproteobacteria]|uniref:tRNA pseudouridine(65) synthase TruC n=1 Tax=Gammaproteobacteria TaxID=1236 RepID=UPI000DCFACC6|nr:MULTISPECIES: tRNA pseudouridine(65) synthase TruC [Gammaproteobacteria]RTE86989.1 tRNA pseudouridine(65) synthase TruC [Aliidiomarina sp. B3213]TCZ93221.1 tRNA pseudouridine(65) synthase TruC [Lysobacter sp. N42]